MKPSYLSKIKEFFKNHIGEEVTRQQMIKFVYGDNKFNKSTNIVDSVTGKLQYRGYIDKQSFNGRWKILKEIPGNLTSTQISSFQDEGTN